MSLKSLSLFILLFSIFSIHGQKKNNFGKLSFAEKEFVNYEKDTTANAVVLYEKGDNYFQVIDNRIQLVKKYHVKIKILNAKGFDEGDISIPYYKTNTASEKVKDIQAITHNVEKKTFVSANKIFTNDLSKRWSEKRFAFPNVKKGSIIEYKYSVISPFLFKLDGWEFQSNIPKLYSEFNAKIPSNYKYNRILVGNLKLSTNEASIEKKCFYIDGYPNPADCEVLQYIMKDIPTFKKEENYMLAASNYISRLDFELSEYFKLNGIEEKYTKSWKDVDKEFKYDKDIGRQLTKKSFFEKNVPEDLLIEGDELTKAKNIYAFIQNHFTWNEKNSTYGKARVKNAFNAKKGNAWEINMSLINLLNAAGIKANLMLSSTRQNGLPKREHPVMSDFNYVLAKVEIAGENYVLDATNKFIPFGMLPFRTLNHYGRVMDFKNESYWYAIKPEAKNKYQVRAQIKLDIAEQKGHVILDILNSGYDAVNKRIALDNYSEDEYLDTWENALRGDIEITSYKIMEERSTNSKTAERFEFELDNVLKSDIVYLNPFLIRFFEKNPFTLEKRNYPVDFGHARNYQYLINIMIPDGYEVHELPENKAAQIGDSMVFFKFLREHNQNQVSISFDLALNSSFFEAEDYNALKEVFKLVTDVQNNSLVVLKKRTQ